MTGGERTQPAAGGKTVSGVLWMAAGSGGQQLFSFVIFAVLARSLLPEAFGLVAIAGAILDILILVSRVNLTEILIQKDVLDEDDKNTAFWASLSCGALLSLSVFLAAAPVAALYGEPELATVLRWMSPVCFLVSLTTVHEAILRRDFGFRLLSARNVSATGVSGIVAVAMALSGFGVMSLVAQRVIYYGWMTFVLLASVRWRPCARFSVPVFRRQIKDGGTLLAASLLGTGNQKVIDLVVGFFLGTTALGYLRIAWRGFELLLGLVIGPVTQVIYSSLSALRGDREAMARAYLKIVRFAAMIALPVFAGAAILAPEFITMAFGRQWEDSVPLFQMLSMAALFVPMIYFKTNILVATGHMRQVLAVNVIEFICSLAIAVFAARISLEAAALGNVVRMALVTPVILWFVRRYAGVSMSGTVMAVVPAALSCVAMIAALAAARYGLDGSGNSILNCLMLVPLGAVVYAGTMAVFDRPAAIEVKRMAMDRLRPLWRFLRK